MGEINHCWTLWTSLLQQVPHSVNLSQSRGSGELWDQNSRGELFLNYHFFHWHTGSKINNLSWFKYSNHWISLIKIPSVI